MGYRRIYQAREFFLSFQVVIEDFGGDVNQLHSELDFTFGRLADALIYLKEPEIWKKLF